MRKIVLILLLVFIFSINTVNILGDTIPFHNGIIIGLESGSFEKESAKTINEFNQSSDWKIYIQKSIFFLGFDRANFTTLISQTPWESITKEEMEEQDLFIQLEVLKDPWNATENIVWIRLLDNGTQEVDMNDIDIDTEKIQVLRANDWYRVLFQYNFEWDAQSQPDEFILAYDQLLLTPQDDEVFYEEIYTKYEILNTKRALSQNQIPDEVLFFYSEINNINYWKNIVCPDQDTDILSIECEPLIKTMVNLPYIHGNWMNNYNIINRESDIEKVFKNSGSVEIELGLEYRINRTENAGIIDIFLDNFIMVYNQEGKSIDPTIIDDIKTEFVFNTKLTETLVVTTNGLGSILVGIGCLTVVYTKKMREKFN
ncbi:MAG: hypothetical protein HeimC3_49040 [Candidatus Heimdallarchaeota archaeon LC_3]|nr:MAG: hypothetical protein HeimC3_49040 [Candidatus Heimdallarchaeota archaeon LC_3]